MKGKEEEQCACRRGGSTLRYPLLYTSKLVKGEENLRVKARIRCNVVYVLVRWRDRELGSSVPVTLGRGGGPILCHPTRPPSPSPAIKRTIHSSIGTVAAAPRTLTHQCLAYSATGEVPNAVPQPTRHQWSRRPTCVGRHQRPARDTRQPIDPVPEGRTFTWWYRRHDELEAAGKTANSADRFKGQCVYLPGGESASRAV